MNWMLCSVLSAVTVLWSAVVVVTRWSPPSLGWYPSALTGASVLYISASMGYLLVDDLPFQHLMITLVHVAMALSVFSCWWLLLRLLHMHGHGLALDPRLTHGLIVVPILLAMAPVLGLETISFVDLSGTRDFQLGPLWYPFVLVLLVVCLTTVGIGSAKAWSAASGEERNQYLLLLFAMALPILFAIPTALELAPVHLMNVGYGCASAVFIIGVSRGWMDHGLGVPVGLVLESDPVPRLFVNRAMRLAYRNPAALQLFPAAAELGGNVLDWMPGQLSTAGGRRLNPRLLQKLLTGDTAGESTRPLLFQVGGDNGRWFALETRSIPERGRSKGCLLSLRDETMLEKYREAALSARQVYSLRRLSSGVAHRFNNLMVGVVGNVDLAQNEIASDAMDQHKVHGILADVKTAGEQAAALAARFAAVGEGAMDQRGLFATTLDLNEQVRDALLLIEHQIPPHITLDVALADVPLIVEFNAAEVTDIVIDLVTNSLEAYGSDSGVVRVSTGYRTVGPEALPDLLNRDGLKEGDMAWLMIADHAGGMQINRDDGLFEPFVSTKDGRQGLGLSAVLASVCRHHGGVDVRNVDGGASVVVYLPRQPLEKTVRVGSVSLEPREREAILVVDDDDNVLQVHSAMLASLGQAVFATTSPDEALQKAILHRFKAALIDVYMPTLSGQELVQRLRKRDPLLPVIFISGYVHEPLRINPDDRHTAFLAKPFGMESLFLTLERVSRKVSPDGPGRVIPMPGVQLER